MLLVIERISETAIITIVVRTRMAKVKTMFIF